MTRRRSLPGGRAVVGALLVTLAVIGVFAAWLSATSVPTTTWVVATGTIAAGDTLTAEDLDTVAIDLPDAQAARALARPDALVGAIAIAPLSAGDLVTRSMVRTPDAAPSTSLFSFELPASRALGGELAPGDRVDVMATDDGRTGFVATGLEVVRGTIEGGAVTITVAVDDPERVLALGNAVDEAAVHLVLSTGVSRDAAGEDTPPADGPFPRSGPAPTGAPGATASPAPTPAGGG